MAISVKLDFENCYNLKEVSPDLKISKFETKVIDGLQILLKIEIANLPHELVKDLYNFAFGPTDSRGKIDDKAELSHANYSKVFSTILLSGLTYLTKNPQHYLGIDGSNEARAHLYYRFIQSNYDYLSQHFNLFGLKYYVRISRFGKRQYDNPFDFEDILPKISPISKGEKPASGKLYNYFVFNLKK